MGNEIQVGLMVKDVTVDNMLTGAPAYMVTLCPCCSPCFMYASRRKRMHWFMLLRV